MSKSYLDRIIDDLTACIDLIDERHGYKRRDRFRGFNDGEHIKVILDLLNETPSLADLTCPELEPIHIIAKDFIHRALRSSDRCSDALAAAALEVLSIPFGSMVRLYDKVLEVVLEDDYFAACAPAMLPFVLQQCTNTLEDFTDSRLWHLITFSFLNRSPDDDFLDQFYQLVKARFLILWYIQSPRYPIYGAIVYQRSPELRPITKGALYEATKAEPSPQASFDDPLVIALMALGHTKDPEFLPHLTQFFSNRRIATFATMAINQITSDSIMARHMIDCMYGNRHGLADDPTLVLYSPISDVVDFIYLDEELDLQYRQPMQTPHRQE